MVANKSVELEGPKWGTLLTRTRGCCEDIVRNGRDSFQLDLKKGIDRDFKPVLSMLPLD